MIKIVRERRTHFQLGDNTNLFDYTYVGNVVKAHLLAADKLGTHRVEDVDLGRRLVAPALTAPAHPIPTSAKVATGDWEHSRLGEDLIGSDRGR